MVPFRWAITSAGKIAADFAHAVRQLEGRLANALAAQQDVNKAGAARLASIFRNRERRAVRHAWLSLRATMYVAVDVAETVAEAWPAREELQRARKALEKHRGGSSLASCGPLAALSAAVGAGWRTEYAVAHSLSLLLCWSAFAGARQWLEELTYSAHYKRERQREAPERVHVDAPLAEDHDVDAEPHAVVHN